MVLTYVSCAQHGMCMCWIGCADKERLCMYIRHTHTKTSFHQVSTSCLRVPRPPAVLLFSSQLLPQHARSIAHVCADRSRHAHTYMHTCTNTHAHTPYIPTQLGPYSMGAFGVHPVRSQCGAWPLRGGEKRRGCRPRSCVCSRGCGNRVRSLS